MENFLIELHSHLLGPKSFATYIAAFFFAGMGASARLYIKSLKRDPQSKSTPRKFSFRFMIWDNLRAFLGGVIIAFLYFRFSNELHSVELTMFYATGIGFAFTQLDTWAEKWESLARDKVKNS